MITLKKSVCLLAFCMLGLIINAQKSEKISFGIKAGINLSKFSDAEYRDNESPKFGFHMGGIMEIPLSKRFALQPELFYTEIGSKSDITNYNIVDFNLGYVDEINHRFNERLGYIKLPVLLKFYLNNRLSIDLGPELGYLVWADYKYESNAGELMASGSGNGKRQYDDFDVSANIGATYNFKNNMFIQARFGMSTYDIFDDDFFDVIETGRKNMVLQFSTGYKF